VPVGAQGVGDRLDDVHPAEDGEFLKDLRGALEGLVVLLGEQVEVRE
jgi:hypothetical protein